MKKQLQGIALILFAMLMILMVIADVWWRTRELFTVAAFIMGIVGLIFVFKRDEDV